MKDCLKFNGTIGCRLLNECREVFIFKRCIEYLGNNISDGQVSGLSPRKIDGLVKCQIPNNVKQVRQFNGLAGYFRRFIPNFPRIMLPLYELTEKRLVGNGTSDVNKLVVQ